MPIMFVNPARKGARSLKRKTKSRFVKPLRGVKLSSVKGLRKKRRNPSAQKPAVRKPVRLIKRTLKRARRNSASRVVKNAVRRTKRTGEVMAHKKLYGAAAKAHAKRLSKLHRKGKKRNPAKKKVSKKSRVAAHMKASMSRGHSYVAAPKKRKRRKSRKAGATKASLRIKRRRAYLAATRGKVKKRKTGVKSLRRARVSIKRARRMGGRAGYYATKHKMHSNPKRRRKARKNAVRHYRKARRMHRNPASLAGMQGALMGAVKMAVPIAASLYITRFLVNKFGGQIPMLDKLGKFQRPAVAGVAILAAHFGTRKGPLAKYRPGIMIGTGINLIDSVISAFAPQEVKAMFGLSGDALMHYPMSDYVTTSDYLEVGAQPIDDDITLSDYVEVGGIEEELGDIQEELGIEQELGALEQATGFASSPRRLGGVSQSSMLKALKPVSAVGVVPQRSFTKAIPRAGSGYDDMASIQTGIFSGGF